MKSLASSLMLANAVLSKSHSAAFTFSIVSRGVFSWNGEIPLNLRAKTTSAAAAAVAFHNNEVSFSILAEGLCTHSM